jgi:hypothetical protein
MLILVIVVTVGVIFLLAVALRIYRRARRRGGTVNVSKIRASKKVAKENPQERGRPGPI